jgi:ParB family chromosome partitioning protein
MSSAKTKNKALDKGLTNLLPSGGIKNLLGKDTQVINEGKPLLVDVSKIEKNPYQPRKLFNKEEISKLSQSIKDKGIIEPLVVIKVEENYQLIAGQRRLMAAKEAKLEKVPVIIHEALQPIDKLELALIENMMRQDLNPIEEAEAFDRLVKEFSKTTSSIAELVKKDRSTVDNSIRLLKLPDEVKTEIQVGRLTAGHGRALLGLEPNINLILKAKNEVLINKLTVRQTESLVKKLQKENEQKDKNIINIKETDEIYYEHLSNEISKTLGGLKIVFKHKGKIKKLEINYQSAEDLDIFIKKLNINIEQ